MADPTSNDPGFVAFRLQEVERRLDKMEKHFDARLDAIAGTIGQLAFVRKDVYESEHRALTEKVDTARALAMWALGTTLTAVALVGTLIGILKLVAG